MVDWEYFKKYDDLTGKYLPVSGEGSTMATQAVTAVAKLVYRFYNDGDVFDNNYGLEGWANDLSIYANWLYHNIPMTKKILERIYDCRTETEYSHILKDLADFVMQEELLKTLNECEKVGCIYKQHGPFKFTEEQEEEE